MKKKRVLVVDDNFINREMLAEILGEKYETLQVENGLEAFELLKSEEGIALILLDMMMPVMDGYTFLDKLKEDKELSLIPVIVITYGNSEENEVAALAHGATDFIPKPFRPQVILHRVESIIKLRENAAMINQLRYDRLTGIYTKDYFYQQVQERLQENPDKNYCLICSNIENFKLFNDLYGTEAGNELLKEVADIIRKKIGTDGIYGRFYADKFVCLWELSKENICRKEIEEFIKRKSPETKSVVMRWGVYKITDRSVSVEQMCDRAFLAANSIKGSYNQFLAVYNDSIRGKLLWEKELTDTMESSLANNEFVVYFQPKYSLNDTQMVGAEALVRWIHPAEGLVPPNEFIPIFEKNGFISNLDKFVWEKVCAYLCRWREKGYPLIPVSVNVSRVDFFSFDLESFFLELTQKYNINPSYLHLEITESAYTERKDQIVDTLNRLRNLGFAIEMDDFGSGYSSLNMLSRIRPDVLKLDMRFVRNETAKPVEYSILSDVINMAHRLNQRVVAEGVETKEQMKRLQSIGCDYVQGYFLSKPLPVSDFETLLAAQPREVVIAEEKGVAETETYSVIVADEESSYRDRVSRLFHGEYNVIHASDAQTVIESVRKNGFSIAAIILSMTLPDDGSARIMKFLRSESGYWQIPVLAVIPDGNKMKELPLALEADDYLCKRHPVFDLHKKVQHLVSYAETQRKMKTLLDEAYHDYMTGLLNRRGLFAALDRLRKENTSVTLCMFDLDNLKKTNDTYGHDVGDSMIAAFTDILKSFFSKEEIVCRYGGDEFIVVFEKLKVDEVVESINAICLKCRNCIIMENLTLSCTCGIATCEKGDTPTVHLVEQADEALYRAKHENKGSYCVWKPSEA